MHEDPRKIQISNTYYYYSDSFIAFMVIRPSASHRVASKASKAVEVMSFFCSLLLGTSPCTPASRWPRTR